MLTKNDSSLPTVSENSYSRLQEVSPYCGTRFSTYLVEEKGATQYKTFPLFCKSWECPHCAKAKAKKIKKIIKTNFTENAVMLTLTYMQKDRSKTEVWTSLGKSWNNLITYVKKKLKIKIKFVRIVEPHKSGYPHIHVILDQFIPTSEALNTLLNYGFGYQMSQKKLSCENAANYVAKYLTKFEWTNDAKKYRKLTKTRVVSMSRGISLSKSQPKKIEVLCSNETASRNDLELQQYVINQLAKGYVLSQCQSIRDSLTLKFSPEFGNDHFDINALTLSQRTNMCIGTDYYLIKYPCAENALLLRKQLSFLSEERNAQIGFASDRRYYMPSTDQLRSFVDVGTTGIT